MAGNNIHDNFYRIGGGNMKKLIIILTLCVVFPSISFAASIEQQRLQGSVQQDQEEQQKPQEQQKTQSDGDKKTDKKIENRKEVKQYLTIPKTLSNYLLKTGQIKDGKVLVKPVP